MSDHAEEQEMEAEALTAIFDTAFEIKVDTQPYQWTVTLYPVDHEDEDEREEANHVACRLTIEVPTDYPDSLPILDIEIVKGLAEEQRQKILTIANEEAESYTGMPAIYAVCEAIRTWLGDNNVKGLDDQSMHAQMMRKKLEDERAQTQAKLQFESQQLKEEMTEAEKEELDVRKRRAEGTPCNKENFEAWKQQFDAEMAKIKASKTDGEDTLKDKTSNKKKSKNTVSEEEKQEGRLTGFQHFTEKSGGLMNLDALEKAAEEAAASGADDVDVDDLDVDEDLFDDDEDLDDLDFDSDDSDEEDLDI